MGQRLLLTNWGMASAQIFQVTLEKFIYNLKCPKYLEIQKYILF